MDMNPVHLHQSLWGRNTWHLRGMLLCHVSRLRFKKKVIYPDSIFTRHSFEIRSLKKSQAAVWFNGTVISTKAKSSFLFANFNFANYSSNAGNNIYPMIAGNDNNANFKSNRQCSRLRKQCPDHQGHTMLTVPINTRTSSFQVPLERSCSRKVPSLLQTCGH